jgi:hypothetical protein
LIFADPALSARFRRSFACGSPARSVATVARDNAGVAISAALASAIASSDASAAPDTEDAARERLGFPVAFSSGAFRWRGFLADF